MQAPSILATLTKIAATQTPDDKQVEQAFAEQAYMMCSNKAGVLMKDPYRIGFEIITKNDDNTRLLGMWGYRLGRSSVDQLLQAPCAFINGRIVMTDLLYRVGSKKFVVHSPDYAQYLVDMEAQEYGKAQDKVDTGRLYNRFHADRFLRTPAAFGKIASADLPEDWQAQVSDWCRQVKVGGVLRDFMTHVGKDTALDTLMAWAAKSAAFEEALATKLDLDTWMPPEMVLPSKTAAVEKDPVLLQFFQGAPTAEMLKQANNPEKVAAELYRRGWAMDAPEDEAAPEHFTVVYDGGPPVLRNPTGPGVCKLITAGGDKVPVVIGNALSSWDLTASETNNCCAPPSCGSARPRLVVLNTGDSQEAGTLYEGSTQLWSESQDMGALEDVGVGVDEMSADDLYCLVDPTSGNMTEPMFLIEKRKVGVVWHAMFARYGGAAGSLVVINPDAAKSHQRNVINTKWRAIAVPHSRRYVQDGPLAVPAAGTTSQCAPEWTVKPLAPASGQDVTASMFSMPGVKEATLRYDPEGAHDLYNIRVGGRASSLMSEKAMTLKLACDLCVHPAVVPEMLKRARNKGVIDFRLEFPTKLAGTMLRIVDSPRFEQTFNNIHQVPEERDQGAVLRTQRTPIYVPNARIGDKQDSVRGARNEEDDSMEDRYKVPHEMILTASPDELAQFADARQLPHVFDHGVMASLAKTYDSQIFLDQYLVKLEDGLDAMARCIFLYYWKPEDWKQLYGADDMKELEDQMLSSFKSLGDLLLALLKKSRTAKGTPRNS